MDYVAEGGFAFSGINGWLDKTSGFAVLLVGNSDESSPQRSNGTRATDHEALPVDADDIAAGRVRITSNVGNAATSCGGGGFGDFRAGLPVRQREDVANASAGCAALRLAIPDSLSRDG